MLDQLLDFFERDRRASTQQQGGVRGKLGALLGGDADEPYRASNQDNDHRNRDRSWDDDDDRSRRSNRREFEPFDFGD